MVEMLAPDAADNPKLSGRPGYAYPAIAAGFFLLSLGVLVLAADLEATFQVESFGALVEGLAVGVLLLGVLLVVLGWRAKPRWRWLAGMGGVLLAPTLFASAGHNLVAAAGWRLQCGGGNAFACHAAGDLYAFGIGLREDQTKAWELYARACSLGRKDSCPLPLCWRLRSISESSGRLGLKSLGEELKRRCRGITACHDQESLLRDWTALLHQDKNWDPGADKGLVAPRCLGSYGVAKTMPAEGLDSLDVVFKRQGDAWVLVTYGTSFVGSNDLGEARQLLLDDPR